MGWFKKALGIEPKFKQTSTVNNVVNQFNNELTLVKKAGTLKGAHYTDYVESVKQLKREKRNAEAIALLLELVDATENESKQAGPGWGVAPWYYEQLAILYRREGRCNDEVTILERYQAQPKAPGVGPAKLAERLLKARELVASKIPAAMDKQ